MVLVPALHPANLIRIGRADTNDLGLARYEQTCLADFAKALRLISQKPEWDERTIWERDSAGRLKNIYPTPDEVIEFCRLARGHLLAVDTETTGESPLDCRMICVGMASANGRVMCVPILNKGGGYYWSQYDAQRVAAALRELFAAHDTPKVAHNYVFDSLVLWSHGLPLGGVVEDCYVESETEFLTETGWKRYDDVHEGERLATVSKDGTLEYQKPVHRVSRKYSGDIYTFETPHSRAVVTDNHRMFVRPFYRQRVGVKEGAWEFRRAENFVGYKPDRFDVRVAFEESDAGGLERADSVDFTEDFATLLGLWITDGCLRWSGDKPRGMIWTQASQGQAISELRRLAKIFGLKEHARVARTCIEVTFHKTDNALAQNLLAWCGRYSKRRRLPKFALKLSTKLRHALLKGLMLGDSGIVAGKHIYRTACRGLAGDVQALALSLGYAATIHWAGDCWGVTMWSQKFDRAASRLQPARNANISKRKRTTRIVCFSVPNETLVTRSRGKPAFHGNTMQMHHVIDSELPHGLGYCGTRYLDVRYWKDDVKGDEGWLGLENETLRSYNLRDCLVTLRLVPIFARELSSMGLWDLYREEIALAGLMGRATVRGLPIDFVRRDGGTEWDHGDAKKSRAAQWQQVRGLGPILTEKMNGALVTLRALSGDPHFDPLKPVALRNLMFGTLGLPVVKLSKSGLLPSTDKEAMVLLALAADTDVQRAGIKALADFKSAHKAKSTFVDGLPIMGDGRLHVFWKLLTTTGRFASSPNAQNWSMLIKKIFGWGVTPGGFMPTRRFVGVDLKQAEMRGISYLAPSQRFLEMYAKELDVHTINVAIALTSRPRAGHKDMSAKTEQYLREQIPLLIAGGSYDTTLTEIANDDSWKTTRTLIKKDGFGRNYGADDDTVFRIERSDRDPETNELSFPFLTKSDVEANGIRWRKMNWEIVAWWDKVQKEVKLAGKHVCPVSGRIRWFREGFKRTHILGHPNQTLIASIVNKRMLEIQAIYDRETGGDCLIVQQVHDAINADSHMDYAQRAGQVLQQAFDPPVPLPGFPNAQFPADKPAIGFHLSDV